MNDPLLPLAIKRLRQSDIRKCNFHQQTEALWGKIKFSKINLVLPLWTFFYLQLCVPNFVALIIRKLPIYHRYMAYVRFFFVWYWLAPFLKFRPLPSKNFICAPGNLRCKLRSCRSCIEKGAITDPWWNLSILEVR